MKYLELFISKLVIISKLLCRHSADLLRPFIDSLSKHLWDRTTMLFRILRWFLDSYFRWIVEGRISHSFLASWSLSKTLNHPGLPFFAVSSGPPVFEVRISPFLWTKLASCPWFLDVCSIYMAIEYRLLLSASQSLLFLEIQMGQMSTYKKPCFLLAMLYDQSQANKLDTGSFLDLWSHMGWWSIKILLFKLLGCWTRSYHHKATGQSVDKVRKGQVCNLY